MTWQAIIDQIRLRWQSILGGSLTGLYVHGSIAFGCFSEAASDIDFLAVVSQPPDRAQKREMIRCLMELAAYAPKKGIEMSVLLEADCRAFRHPMPYLLHYSSGHHEAYAVDMDQALDRLQGTDPDLAAHVTVTRAVGLPLLGPAPQEMFAPVPAEDYMDSIRGDVENAAEDVLRDPVYILLNLCRVLAFAQEGLVLSKAGGGEWGMRNLPAAHGKLLQTALDCYRTGAEFSADETALAAFVGDMNRRLGL